jgi:ABC-type branched-subunit amino acid transport system ATPase component/predicted MFS family arabinose efflux permease
VSVTEDPDAQVAQAASLADAVLQAEAERQAAQAEKEVLFADDLLPGVGDEELTLREGLRRGGSFTFLMLLLLNSAEQLENATLGVLAPDIRDSFGVSDGVIVFISAAAGGFLVLGALPMGWLADRYRRSPIVAASAAVFSLMVFLSGLTVNAFTLFMSRFGVGIAKSATIPVHGSLIADTYPIGVRGRLSATTMGTGLVIGAISPALVGGIATLAGGENGWRWAFIVLSLPALALAVLALRIPEPPRGQFEMKDVLGQVIDTRPVSISVEAAFSRLRQVRTLRTVMAAFAAIGFGLFTGPVLQGLYVEDRFGLDALERGLLGSLGGLFVVAILPFAARGYDARFREDPARALRLVGLLILPVSVFIPLQYSMPNALSFAIVGVIPMVLMMTAFTMVGPVLQSVVPYRLRGLGAALGSIYIFFIGATGGALLAAFFADAIGPRAAVIILMVPSTLVGGLLIVRSSMFIKNDLSLVVAELREEMDEFKRQQADPEDIPVLQVNNIDFAYGHVQVLFDVGFEVRRGEVLALLGTNGAGKSTILRAIAGLGTPARGVVRLNGQTITYVSPERRGRLGIRLLPGGKGVFPQMTVRENLEVAGFVYRGEPDELERRIAKVLELFDDLADRQDQPAGSLSGGQQQMLALGCTLLHEPEVLLIDELSLGLSPIMVQQLLGVVERLKGEGTTIVIVEQSLNVALAMADRAVFLEKGQVRFEGQARELLDRDDLARAVFLGREGG